MTGETAEATGGGGGGGGGGVQIADLICAREGGRGIYKEAMQAGRERDRAGGKK